MSTAKPTRKAPPGYAEEAQLAQMKGPMRVTVHKNTNGKMTPIPMPNGPQASPGQAGEGYLPDDIRALPQLLLRMSGGGTYRVEVVDEDGKSFVFAPWFPEAQYESKIPPSLGAEAAPPPPAPAFIPLSFSQAPQQQQQPQQQGVSMSDWMASVPPGTSVSRTQGGQPQQGQMIPFGGPGWSPPPAAESNERVRDRDRLHELEEKLREERERRIRDEAMAERERIQRAADMQIAALKEEMRRLSEKSSAGEPELARVLRENQERTERLIEKMSEGKRSEESGTSMVAMMQMMMNQQAAQQQTMMQVLTARPNGPDPSIMMMLEAFKTQSEATREAARQQAESTRERERNTIGPRDLIDMTEKLRASSGVDNILKSVSEAYGGVMGLMKSAAEMVQGMSGGGNPTHPAVEMGLGAIQKIAQDYITMRRDVSVADARARIATVQAGAQQRPPQRARASAPPVQGVPVNVPAESQGATVIPITGQPTSNPTTDLPPSDAIMQDIEEKELQLFGLPLVVQKVHELRKLVVDKKAAPKEVGTWVFEAINYLSQQNALERVPVFKLLEQQMYAEFVKALLPDVDQEFVGQVVAVLMNPGEAAGDEDGEEDDEEEEGA